MRFHEWSSSKRCGFHMKRVFFVRSGWFCFQAHEAAGCLDLIQWIACIHVSFSRRSLCCRASVATLWRETWWWWRRASFADQCRASGGSELDGFSLAAAAMATSDGETKCASCCSGPSIKDTQKSLWCFFLFPAIKRRVSGRKCRCWSPPHWRRWPQLRGLRCASSWIVAIILHFPVSDICHRSFVRLTLSLTGVSTIVSLIRKTIPLPFWLKGRMNIGTGWNRYFNPVQNLHFFDVISQFSHLV